MSKQKDFERLTEAAAAIREVMDEMSVVRSKCAHCGHVTYENFTEAQDHKELEAVVNKLKRIAAKTITKIAEKGNHKP